MAEAAVLLHKNKKMAILALTPTINPTQTLQSNPNHNLKTKKSEQMSTHSLLSYTLYGHYVTYW